MVHGMQMEAEAPSLDERAHLLEGMLCQDSSTDNSRPPWLQDAAAQTAGLLPRVGSCSELWPFFVLPCSMHMKCVQIQTSMRRALASIGPFSARLLTRSCFPRHAFVHLAAMNAGLTHFEALCDHVQLI